MSAAAAARYRELTAELLGARARAPDGELSEVEEAERATELDQWWRSMTRDEQVAYERENGNELAARGAG